MQSHILVAGLMVLSCIGMLSRIGLAQQTVEFNRVVEFNRDVQPLLSAIDIIDAQKFTKKIYLSPKIERYIVRVVEATRLPSKYGIERGKYVGVGGSPRSSIALYIAGKAHALMNGRGYVLPDDIKAVTYNVLRHRILLNFEGEAEEITTESIIKELLGKVPII